jgi:hypothetical protein
MRRLCYAIAFLALSGQPAFLPSAEAQRPPGPIHPEIAPELPSIESPNELPSIGTPAEPPSAIEVVPAPPREEEHQPNFYPPCERHCDSSHCWNKC